MFDLFDWLRLLLSAIIILPLTTIVREFGYYLAATILGSKEKKLVIGSGPVLFKVPTIEVRRYFFMNSWMEYEELNPSGRFWHGFIYASPILTTGGCAIIANSLVLEGILPNNIFWQTFIFYCFYYVFFDIVPVYLPDGQPTNGRAIFDLIYYGERSDYLRQKNSQSNEQRAYTDKQQETMENRDKDEREHSDHTQPK